MARRMMSQANVKIMAHVNFPSFLRARNAATILDTWTRGEQYGLHNGDGAIVDTDPDAVAYGRTYAPRAETQTGEYSNLQSLAPNAFGGLVVTTLAQTAYIEGIRRAGKGNVDQIWHTFRRNRWLSKQTSIHRAAIGAGVSYGMVTPGSDPLTGAKMAKMSAYSAKRMAAFYDNDDDEWPTLAILADPRYEDTPLGYGLQVGWYVTLIEPYFLHHLSVNGNGLNEDDWTYIDHDEHKMPVTPVVRCVNRIDLDGRTTGEIEPVLPLLRRIDQDVFDRLIIQRFGAWQVRYISGMAAPTKVSEQRAQALKLSVADILISDSKDTKFGTLPGGSLDPQIKATDADLRLLSAISQTPPHHLLGLSSNLQAEALAAAESGLQRKSFDFRTNAGDFHEQMARLVAMAQGDMATATAFDLSVRWRDTESRSITQAADALGKLAVQLKVPVEMLWEKIPGWNDDDVLRAKELVEDGTFQKLIQELYTGDGDENLDQAAAKQGAPADGDE